MNNTLQPAPSPSAPFTFWDYVYIYWHQNLCSAEPQQVLFAMLLRCEAHRLRVRYSKN